jgi:hypothetical protein
VNTAGKVVKASVTTLTSALNDYVAGQTVAINPSRRAGSGFAFDSALLGSSSLTLACALNPAVAHASARGNRNGSEQLASGDLWFVCIPI